MSTFDPSRGGIGTRLNTPKNRFILTPKSNTLPIKDGKTFGIAFKIWNSKAKIIANPKLARTPAADTKSSPFLKLVKFKGLTGTGFAQAKSTPGGVPVKRAGIKINAGSNIVPTRSM